MDRMSGWCVLVVICNFEFQGVLRIEVGIEVRDVEVEGRWRSKRTFSLEESYFPCFMLFEEGKKQVGALSSLVWGEGGQCMVATFLSLPSTRALWPWDPNNGCLFCAGWHGFWA